MVVAGRAAVGPASRIGRLVEALHRELDLRADALDATFGTSRPGLRSVYLGGGTPSLLSAAQVGGLLEHAARRLGLIRSAEVSLEANPGPGERGDLHGLRSAGVDRLSLGAQSLQAAELRAIGRRHSPQDVVDAVDEARRAGFRSVSLDLLLDLPGQTRASWRSTLDRALALAPDHLSAYALTLDDPDAEGLAGPDGDHLPLRPGARRWRERARSRQDDDRAAGMYEDVADRLSAAGYDGYELSNWARPGHRSRHNLAYWLHEPVEAIGPGAHAFDGGATRRWNAADLDRYLAALASTPPRLPPGGADRLEPDGVVAERLILGLRLDRGVRLQGVPLRHRAALGWAEAAGLAERSLGTDRVRLSRRGRLLSNEVFLRLLEPDPALLGSVHVTT